MGSANTPKTVSSALTVPLVTVKKGLKNMQIKFWRAIISEELTTDGPTQVNGKCEMADFKNLCSKFCQCSRK